MAWDFNKQGIRRLAILAFIIAFLFSLDAFRVFYISTVKGDEFAAKAESQQLSDLEIEAKRGSIYDSDGNVLAQSATTWDIFMCWTPSMCSRKQGATIQSAPNFPLTSMAKRSSS